MRNGIFHLVTGTAVAIALSASPASAQKKYDTGATDTEIKIGQTVPFSGPASAYATIGRTQAAYIKMINDQGGINGRKINLIQYDDAYSPPKTVEQVRKLVERRRGAAYVPDASAPRRTSPCRNTSTGKKVPQLFAATGASKFTDPEEFPVDHGFQPELFRRRPHLRHRTSSRAIRTPRSASSIQNDDLGKDYSDAVSRPASATRRPR